MTKVSVTENVSVIALTFAAYIGRLRVVQLRIKLIVWLEIPLLFSDEGHQT